MRAEQVTPQGHNTQIHSFSKSVERKKVEIHRLVYRNQHVGSTRTSGMVDLCGRAAAYLPWPTNERFVRIKLCRIDSHPNTDDGPEGVIYVPSDRTLHVTWYAHSQGYYKRGRLRTIVEGGPV